MQEDLESARIVVALRAARVAVGWTQDELARILGVAKSTIARVETMEGSLRAETLGHMISAYKRVGIDLDLYSGEDIKLTIHPAAIREAKARLEDEGRRRSDRKLGRTIVAGSDMTIRIPKKDLE